MTDTARSQANIDSEASLWLAQRRMQSSAEFDQSGFDAWLAADVRNEAAYALMSRASLAASASLQVRLNQGDTIVMRPRSRAARWIAPAGALAAAAAVALVVFGLPIQTAPQESHVTEIAQIEAVTLPDGSVVTLGPASHIDVAFSERERRVVLTAGEAFFEVTHDTDRPFFVEAGDALVRVVGTKFDVHRGGDQVRVSVAEGVVQVRAASLPIARASVEPVVLRAGDVVQVAENAPLLGAVNTAVATAPPASAGAWRNGRLTYIEAPLSDLVADLNRYYAPGVRLADPELGAYRLTAAFRADELDTFFSTLPAAAPVVVTRGAHGEIVIARAN